ncbi:hypothetical protein MNY66_17870 (plasmid) [Moellerella wisconsensis]|uniref:Uncharacterized protein n=1 Tax=Moellerella wisconsensis TaxID=158849 RepID=A0ACD3YCE1_9GAMM|nr:hypothetical protein [Moellerella wisconsensis]EIU7558797.1 hypothetical protein [Providencia rettgeri]UNH40726.1 hypothetical protein MNY70_17995 [Moellerella wisconsensis]UNH44206.1 hypothetical protein MNY66_17870 [Moellerella wisconsensis]
MNKFKSAVVAVSLALILTGCTRTAAINTPTTTITANVSADKVKEAILLAGKERKWIMTQVKPGVIDARYVPRGHSVSVRINYTATSYTINYVSSNNMKAGDGKIHKNYNRWINNLDVDIQRNIMTLK